MQPFFVREGSPTDAHKFSRELFGLFLLFWALLLLLSLASFDANDPSLNHVVSGSVEVQNKAGLFGAYAAGFLNDVFGVAAFLWPLVFGALGAAYVSPAYALHWWRWCGFFLLTICLLVMGAAWDLSLGDLWGGGMVGSALHDNASRYLSPGGSALLWLFVLLVGLQLACNISWFSLAARFGHWLRGRLDKHFDGKFKSTEKSSESEMPRRAWRLPRLRLPQWSSLTQWRDKLGDIRPMADSLPEVYEEKHPSKSGADKTEPVTVSVASVDDDSDDPFAVAEDLGGTPLVSTAANPEKEPEAAPEDSAPATPEASRSGGQGGK